MIFHLLKRYGFDLNSGIVPFKEKLDLEAPTAESEIASKRVFLVLTEKSDFQDREPKALSTFSKAAKSFFETLCEHLAFRFNQRQNNRLYEVIGVYVDPLLKKFAKSVFGDSFQFGDSR